MARKPRVEFAGATYHVMCRGNHQEAVFKDAKDNERFLDTLEEVSERNGWLIHAFVLMSNHYHLLLETPEPNLVDGMQWLQSTYTQRFNARHKVWGHLFQGRYKALPVDHGEYFRTVADYIHLNPVRAHACDLEKGSLGDYTWSSYCGLMRPAKRPGFLSVKRVLASHGLADDASGRSRYRNYMKRRILDILHSTDPMKADEQWQKIRRGWAYGSDGFLLRIQGVLDSAVSGKRRDSFMGEEMRMHDEQEAEKLVQHGLDLFGLQEEDLKTLKKGDDRKKVIAWYIRKKTSVRVEWITQRLQMGVTSNFSRYIRAVGESKQGPLWKLKSQMTI
ncbi:transposase [Pontiellaceae bacterium B1224]|nr:transposase [Pontiellaceae bacterium B1224]